MLKLWLQAFFFTFVNSTRHFVANPNKIPGKHQWKCCVMSSRWRGEIDLTDYFHSFRLLRKRLMWSGWTSGAGGSTPSAGGRLQREDKPPHNTDINQLYHNTPPVFSRTVSAEIVSTRHQKRDGNGGIRSFRTFEIWVSLSLQIVCYW